MNMFLKVLVSAAIVLGACDASPERAVPSSTPTTPNPTSPGAARGDGRFDELTIRLQLEARRVRSGREIWSFVDVSNNSGHAITDPRCLLASTSSALVPVTNPDAELWQQVVVDCAGPFRYPDGFIDRRAGPRFVARTKFGDPLPPGEYLATLEIPGYSERLTQLVEVID